MRGVKLGPTYFIPNFQIGSFGAITPIVSTIKVCANPLLDLVFFSLWHGGCRQLSSVPVGESRGAVRPLPPH